MSESVQGGAVKRFSDGEAEESSLKSFNGKNHPALRAHQGTFLISVAPFNWATALRSVPPSERTATGGLARR